MNDNWFEFLTTIVAGVQHHEFASDPAGLTGLGGQLVLIREATNPHDHNAVRVVVMVEGTPDRTVGYIPRTQALAIAAMMDHGYEFRVVLEGADKRGVAITLKLPDFR